MKTFKFTQILVLSLTLFMSCSGDDPAPVNEEEVITTLTLTLTPEAGGAPIIFQSQDLDGDGPDDPVITISGDLQDFTTYIGTVEVLNELESPADDITLEVLEEGEDHQFFYVFSPGGSGISVTYTDADANGDPIGQQIELETNNASVNTMTVVLRHEGDKSAAGVSDGNIENAGGETDVEVTFTFNVVN